MSDGRNYVTALLEERQAYVQQGMADRVAAVDSELARFNVEVDKKGNVTVPPEYETTEADHSDVETAVVKPKRRSRRAKAADSTDSGASDADEDPDADPDADPAA